MQPAAMCFSVMVRPDDSQTGHSVIRLTAKVEVCLGPRNNALENTARESVKSSKHLKTPVPASQRDVFKRTGSTVENLTVTGEQQL